MGLFLSLSAFQGQTRLGTLFFSLALEKWVGGAWAHSRPCPLRDRRGRKKKPFSRSRKLGAIKPSSSWYEDLFSLFAILPCEHDLAHHSVCLLTHTHTHTQRERSPPLIVPPPL